jgi:pyruvate dehydrogenase E2 component (dihydrolipoamide acetyltransferase)
VRAHLPPVAVPLRPNSRTHPLHRSCRGRPLSHCSNRVGLQPPVTGGRIYVSPLVRKRAREEGIDLSRSRHGSWRPNCEKGPRILSRRRGPRPSVPCRRRRPTLHVQAAAGAAGYTDRPHTGMRRAIARRLTESKTTVPHFYVTADCRVEKLLQARTEMNEATGVKVSVNDWVMKAVAKALMEVPDANVIWMEDALRYFPAPILQSRSQSRVDYSPVLRGVESMSLTQINAEVTAMATKAREGKISQAEIEGGSFSSLPWDVWHGCVPGHLEPATVRHSCGGGCSRSSGRPGWRSRCGQSNDSEPVSRPPRGGRCLAAEWMKAFRHYIENPMALLA